jgi:hypothetical protein
MVQTLVTLAGRITRRAAELLEEHRSADSAGLGAGAYWNHITGQLLELQGVSIHLILIYFI